MMLEMDPNCYINSDLNILLKRDIHTENVHKFQDAIRRDKGLKPIDRKGDDFTIEIRETKKKPLGTAAEGGFRIITNKKIETE